MPYKIPWKLVGEKETKSFYPILINTVKWIEDIMYIDGVPMKEAQFMFILIEGQLHRFETKRVKPMITKSL